MIIFISSALYGQNPQAAPLNPEFVEWMKGLNQAQEQNTDGHSLGLRPSPFLPNFAKTNKPLLKAAAFLSKYDLRTAGPGETSLLTLVKDQGDCGACWTFATMGAVEGYAKKMDKGDYDLSENNLKECHGFEWTPCDGGNRDLSTAYFARKSGPVSELNDPYNESEVGCKSNIYPEFWVSDIRYLPNDPNIIKQTILDYGALATNMFWSAVNYNSTNYTYYSTGATTTNHAVLLVGWDDTKVTAGGTGAWIIRNSWGSGWGENGFFYISYNDSKVNTSVTSFQNIDNRISNSTEFGYDQLGMTNTTGYGSDIAYGLVRFSPGNKNYTLKQLSTYVASGSATLRLEVYDDFNGTTLSNLMGTITNKTCDLPGYYTFDLTTPIQVNANNDFYIKVYYNTVDYNYPIPIETAISDYAAPVIESGRCWISFNGNNWSAIGSDQTNKYDLCIKAYGEYVPCTPPTIQASVFTSSTIADNSMTIGWTRGNGSAVLVAARKGSAVNSDPDSDTNVANAAFGSGTQIGTGNYVVYNGTGTSVNLTALTSGTTYYYSIYEYNPASNCYTIPALTGSATSTGIPPYCTAGSSATTYEYISNVSIGSINQTSGGGTDGYQDYTSKIATMQIGVNTSAKITITNKDSNDRILIWIDWNQNGVFTDPGENVYTSNGSFASPHTTSNFAPPAGAKTGNTRMRIRLHDSSIGPNTTPCGNSSYGEVEDYTINVASVCTPPAAPSVGAITQPTCTLATGSVNLTGLPGTETWTLTRNPGGSTTTGTGTSSTLSGLAAGTYTYTVTNASGCTSPVSPNVVINSQPDSPTAPNATAATSILQTSLTSNWTGSTLATGYRLDVATNIGFTTFVTGYNNKDVSNVTTFNITGLNPITTYYLRVRAYNLCGAGPNSGTVTVTTLPNPPAAPTTKPCTDLVQTSFSANWNAVATATGYRLDIATNTAFTTFVTGYNDKEVGNVTTYRISGLSAITQYYFRVRGYNAGGTGQSSITLPVTTLTNPPAAPVGLTASSCNNLVTLKWRKNSDPYFIRYHIYGGVTNNPTTRIDVSSDAITDTTKVISGLTNGQTYYFAVTAVNYDGPESAFSPQSSAKVKTGVIPVVKTKWGDLLICNNLGDSIRSYQWYNGSSLIPNAISQYYTTNKTVGTYKVETIDINGCKNTSNTAITSGTKSLVLYPNPASVSFSIKLKDAPGLNDVSDEKVFVSIINSAGIKVMDFKANNVNDELLNAISVSNLSNGTYIVQVLANQQDLYYSKIVVLK